MRHQNRAHPDVLLVVVATRGAVRLGVIAACAVDHKGFSPYYAEPGANQLVCGPSGNVNVGVTTTQVLDGWRQDFSGTSAAAPQVSGVVAALKKADNDFSELIGWIKAHLSESMSVESLAARAMMSPRNFQRKFNARLGQPPARFVETLRLQHAHGLLSSGLSAKIIATTCGYPNPQQLAKAYQRRYGSTPARFLRDRQDQG